MNIIDLGTTPISKDTPAGKDVRYDPNFESLAEEIGKLGSPSATSGVNWDTVVTLASNILATESKHLQVATYLNYGLIKTQGIEGLYPGVHVVKTILENFWDTMFPTKKRMKGRVGIVEWWAEKLSDFISETDTVVWAKEKRDKLVDDLDFIDDFLGKKIDDPPLLFPLIKKIKDTICEEELPKTLENPPEPQHESEPISIPPNFADNPPKPARPQSAEQAVDSGQTKKTAGKSLPDSNLDAPSLLGQGLSLLGKAASVRRKENKFHALPYRLNRIVAWATLEELPAAAGGKTMISPPEEQIVSAITGLYDSGNWEALVDSCEGRVRQFLFWLDLSRYSAESMEQMGHPDVARIIEAETALFVQTLEGVERLSFSDGTPFADAATLEWLKQLKTRDSGQTDIRTPGESSGIHQEISEKMSAAQNLIKEKQPDAALMLFKEHRSKASNERDHFLWKQGLCQLLINLKQIQIASPYIDDMLENVDRFNLEVWEPHMAIDALSLALTGLRLQKKDQNKPLIESIVKRISMLDPVKALEIV